MDTGAIYISLKGIQGLGKKSLAFLLSSQTNRKYELVDEHPDAIIIIDYDDFRGKAAWDEIQSHQSATAAKSTILIGFDPVDEAGTVCLRKPFSPGDILAAIDTLVTQREQLAREQREREERLRAEQLRDAQARQERARTKAVRPDRARTSPFRRQGNNDRPAEKNHLLQQKPGLSSNAATSLNEKELHTFIGSATDADLNDPAAIAAVQYSPERFLAYHLGNMIRLALKKRQYVQLNCCDSTFIVDPHKHCIHTDASPRRQRSLGALPMTGKKPAYHKLSELPTGMETGQQCYPWEAFVWRMALACSRGRLPEGTSLHQRYRLRRWPNLTRLTLFPHATRISAAWVSAPLSIAQVLKQLSLPQRYVFAFFSAASATGLLTEAEPAPAARENPSSQNQPNQRRGLFRRLLKTLYRKQKDECA